MLPALDGAVVVSVNAAVPLLALAARPLLSVTVHVTSAPAEFSGEHVTLDTPALQSQGGQAMLAAGPAA